MLLISADSHVLEDPQLWKKELPRQFQDDAPEFPPYAESIFSARPGGSDPVKRLDEMTVDGVSGEVLYPSSALDLFGLTDPELQEACFRVYNDWLLEYCSYAPDRLFGIVVLSAFNIEHAVTELSRCSKSPGVVGALVWQHPPTELGFDTQHYDPLWEAAADLAKPVSLHIATGAGYRPNSLPIPDLVTIADLAVNLKLYHAMSALSSMFTSGVFDRFPTLKVVLVENEVSWLPFAISQWDKYAAWNRWESVMERLPSEYFEDNIYCTFFNDPPARRILGDFANRNLLWSNDYPHHNSTWPNSRDVIERDMGHIDPSTQQELLAGNVTRLYGIQVPASK